MKIRKATLRDSKKILKLFNSDANLVGDDELKYKDYHIQEYLTNPIHKLFVAEIDKKVVGALLTEFWKKAQYVYMNDLVIDKKFQGKGIGTALNNYVEDLAKKQGHHLIFFFTEVDNKKMQSLAKKLNFKKGKKFYFFSKGLK